MDIDADEHPGDSHARLKTEMWDNWNGKRIGYIRLRNMSPPSVAQALQQFERELAFFQENTDGLVVDVMRNTGGIIVYGHEIARRLIPRPMTGVGFELRATATRLANLSAELEFQRQQGAPQWVLDLYTRIVTDVRLALAENRGRTGPLPLNMPSLDEIQPAAIVYTKPLIVLIDELSVSTADLFPAMMQDNKRGLLVGTRTAGLGGTNGSFPASPTFTEGVAGVTFGLMVRKTPVQWEKGTTQYIENVGVFPDVELDYMTADNLVNRGRTFVSRFSDILLGEINKAAQ
ncbi:MAG: hypothetical protein FJW30_22830 [Acidobacteria bacterium]|nr:hypothetical protein [Acidobacteriota bacterium]